LAFPGRNVVDGDATVGLCGEPVIEEESDGRVRPSVHDEWFFIRNDALVRVNANLVHAPVWNLRYTLVGAITGLEVKVRRPIVGQIVGGTASSTGREVANVRRRHGRVEGVAPHNLVHVRGAELAWVDERVESLDGDLRASESEVV
jgi:hypothetical protein